MKAGPIFCNDVGRNDARLDFPLLILICERLWNDLIAMLLRKLAPASWSAVASAKARHRCRVSDGTQSTETTVPTLDSVSPGQTCALRLAPLPHALHDAVALLGVLSD